MGLRRREWSRSSSTVRAACVGVGPFGVGAHCLPVRRYSIIVRVYLWAVQHQGSRPPGALRWPGRDTLVPTNPAQAESGGADADATSTVKK